MVPHYTTSNQSSSATSQRNNAAVIFLSRVSNSINQSSANTAAKSQITIVAANKKLNSTVNANNQNSTVAPKRDGDLTSHQLDAERVSIEPHTVSDASTIEETRTTAGTPETLTALKVDTTLIDLTEALTVSAASGEDKTNV